VVEQEEAQRGRARHLEHRLALVDSRHFDVARRSSRASRNARPFVALSSKLLSSSSAVAGPGDGPVTMRMGPPLRLPTHSQRAPKRPLFFRTSCPAAEPHGNPSPDTKPGNETKEQS
jgi:hypothetical protein